MLDRRFLARSNRLTRLDLASSSRESWKRGDAQRQVVLALIHEFELRTGCRPAARLPPFTITGPQMALVDQTRGKRRASATPHNSFVLGSHNARNRSSVGKRLALRPEILSPSPNATDGATCATRREAWVTGFDRGAGAALLKALSHRPGGFAAT